MADSNQEQPQPVEGRRRRAERVRTLLALAAVALLWACWSGYKIALIRGLPKYDPQSAVGFFYSESATHYRYYRLIADPATPWEQVLPVLRCDVRVQYPEGIEVLREFPFGMELFYGLLRRWLAPATAPHVFLVHAIAVYTGLSLVMVFAMTWRVTGSRGWALMAAALYGTLTWSFTRTVRGSFLYEDFALPFLLGAITLCLPGSGERGRRAPLPEGVLAGVLAGCATAFWHVSQYPLALSAALLSLRTSQVDEREPERRFCKGLAVGFAAAALAFPVLRGKVFLLSLPMAAILHWLLWSRLRGPAAPKVRLAAWAGSLLGIVLLFALLNPKSRDYSHVLEYALARLRYPFGAPSDPRGMSFAARTLWEHSFLWADVDDVIGGLRFGLLMLPFLAVPVARRGREAPAVRVAACLAYATLVAGLLMRRFLVPAAPFFAVASVAGFALLHGRWKRLRRVWPVLGAAVVLLNVETLPWEAPPSRNPPREIYGPLVEWLKANTDEEDAFFARMNFSAILQLHTGRPSLVHPIYEAAWSREKNRILLEGAFQDEESFRELLVRFKASYFVYDFVFAMTNDPGTPRYCAGDAGPLQPDWTVTRCNFHPESLRWLDLVWQNDVFRVFRVLERPADPTDPARLERIGRIVDNAYTPVFDARNFEGQGGRTEQAFDRIRRSIALANEGIFARAGGEPQRAEQLLEDAVRLLPNNLDAHLNLALLAAECGRPEQGARHLAEACRIAPRSDVVAAIRKAAADAP